jgi:hypothetical protein
MIPNICTLARGNKNRIQAITVRFLRIEQKRRGNIGILIITNGGGGGKLDMEGK